MLRYEDYEQFFDARKGEDMRNDIIFDKTFADGFRTVVRNLRATTGVAGQRTVTVDVDYYDREWEEHTSISFVRYIDGGPVVAFFGHVRMLVYDAEQYGDTNKLDESWIRNFFGGGNQRAE